MGNSPGEQCKRRKKIPANKSEDLCSGVAVGVQGKSSIKTRPLGCIFLRLLRLFAAKIALVFSSDFRPNLRALRASVANLLSSA
jgi:hypothetical protein